MFLLLNNNKYLHQIVESLFYCLKKNKIKCEIVYSIDERKSLNKDIDDSKIKGGDIYDIEKLTNDKNNLTSDNINDESSLTLEPTRNIFEIEKLTQKNINFFDENGNDNSSNSKDDIKKTKKNNKDDKSKNENIYILFNINSLDVLPNKYIVYNFEQLTTERVWDISFFDKCKNAIKIFDYSLENIKVFKKENIEAYHLPFGWCSVLENKHTLEEKDIDLLFLGSLNKRRLNTISKLNTLTHNFYIHNKCFDKDYDIVTSKSKVGLNIHYYDGDTILELTRIIPWICSGIHVISERSNDKFYDRIFNKVITFYKKGELYEKVKDAINNYDLEKMKRKKKILKKNLNFEKIISENINLFKHI